MKKEFTKWLWVVPLVLTLIVSSCKKSTINTGDSDIDLDLDNTEDFVENQTWSKTIYIAWDGTNVTVNGEATGVSVSTKSGYVTIKSTVKEVEYCVSGEGTGQLNIYSDYKFKLTLEGLKLTCTNGPAINNQCKKHCYIILKSDNTLSDGSSYASSSEDRKAALFSEGQICFSGSGSLSVTGNYKHALASDDYIRLCSGTGSIDLTAKVSDGLHTNDGVIIDDGTLTITATSDAIQCDTSSIAITGGAITIKSAGDKGITAYGNIDITGGTIRIKSSYKCIKAKGNITISGGDIQVICSGTASNTSSPEGIEAKGSITISGGKVYAQANDDAINAGGDLTITDGYVCAYSTGNDGLDANGDCYIKGGLIYAIASGTPEVAIDANTEQRHKLYVSGGIIVAIGGLERGSSLTQSCYSTSSWTPSKWYALYNGSTLALAFSTPSSGGTPLVVSTSNTPVLKANVTATSGTAIFNGMALLDATISGGTSATLSDYSSNSGGGGGNPPDRP